MIRSLMRPNHALQPTPTGVAELERWANTSMLAHYLSGILFFVLAFSGFSQEIPADFLKSTDPHWIECFERKIHFTRTELAAIDMVEQLHVPHIFTRENDKNAYNLIVKLPSIVLDQRTALWELGKQTRAVITIDTNVAGTLDVEFSNKKSEGNN